MLAAASAALLASGCAHAAPLYAPNEPSEMRLRLGDGSSVSLLGGYNYYSGTVVAAYQKVYAMNFEIWKPFGLPSGWYATFDGYPVAQAAENVWVYGKMNSNGTIMPTDVLVGSVVPHDVPALTRVASTWVYHDFIHNLEFCKIKDKRCHYIGVLDDPLIGTPIAWSRDDPGVYLWLADHWIRIDPLAGEYTRQALKRKREWIAIQLRSKGFWWRGSEHLDLADIARQWGFLWGGRVSIDSVSGWSNDSDGTRSQSAGFSSPGNAPDKPADNGSQWDVGD